MEVCNERCSSKIRHQQKVVVRKRAEYIHDMWLSKDDC